MEMFETWRSLLQSGRGGGVLVAGLYADTGLAPMTSLGVVAIDGDDA